MKEITITQGKTALVDDEDYDYLNQMNWYCMKNKMGGYYASTPICSTGKPPKTLLMHRLILNARKGIQVDHINHSGLDNRKENLRLCTNSQNGMNRLPSKHKKYKGVRKIERFYKEKVYTYYEARITKDEKEKYLGIFKTEEEAVEKYNKTAIEYFGNFAMINQISNLTADTEGHRGYNE